MSKLTSGIYEWTMAHGVFHTIMIEDDNAGQIEVIDSVYTTWNKSGILPMSFLDIMEEYTRPLITTHRDSPDSTFEIVYVYINQQDLKAIVKRFNRTTTYKVYIDFIKKFLKDSKGSDNSYLLFIEN